MVGNLSCSSCDHLVVAGRNLESALEEFLARQLRIRVISQRHPVEQRHRRGIGRGDLIVKLPQPEPRRQLGKIIAVHFRDEGAYALEWNGVENLSTSPLGF